MASLRPDRISASSDVEFAVSVRDAKDIAVSPTGKMFVLSRSGKLKMWNLYEANNEGENIPVVLSKLGSKILTVYPLSGDFY